MILGRLSLFPWQAMELPPAAPSAMTLSINIPFKTAGKIITALKTQPRQADCGFA